MSKTVKAVTMYELTCLRCGGSWTSKTPTASRCGKAPCRSPYWDRPRRTEKK